MIVINRKVATLKLMLDGVEKTLTYPVDQLEDYRKVSNIIKSHQNLTTSTSGDDAALLDEALAFIESCRVFVKEIVGEEAYNEVIGESGGDIPMMSWIAILSAIEKDMRGYLDEAVGVEGEL